MTKISERRVYYQYYRIHFNFNFHIHARRLEFFRQKKVFPTSKMFLFAQFSGIALLLPFVIIKFHLLGAIPPKVWFQVTAAGFFQAIYFAGLAGAYRHGDFSIAYPVVRSLPVFFVMLITLLLGQGEQISFHAITGIILVGIAACGTTGYSLIDDAALAGIFLSS